MITVETKTCRHCKEIKNIDLTNFYKNKITKDGHGSWCIPCTIKNAKKYADENNPERIREYKRKWKKSNKEKVRQGNVVIAENKKSGSYSTKDWQHAIEYFDNECAYCGSSDKKLNKEHIVPISKGGLSVPNNIIPACAQCNSSKWRHEMYEWYSKKEFFNNNRLKRINEYITRQSAV